jgi:hypothetical protein
MGVACYAIVELLAINFLQLMLGCCLLMMLGAIDVNFIYDLQKMISCTCAFIPVLEFYL